MLIRSVAVYLPNATLTLPAGADHANFKTTPAHRAPYIPIRDDGKRCPPNTLQYVETSQFGTSPKTQSRGSSWNRPLPASCDQNSCTEEEK